MFPDHSPNGFLQQVQKTCIKDEILYLMDGEFIFPCMPVCYRAVLCRTGLSHSLVWLLALLSFIRAALFRNRVKAGEKSMGRVLLFEQMLTLFIAVYSLFGKMLCYW